VIDMGQTGQLDFHTSQSFAPTRSQLLRILQASGCAEIAFASRTTLPDREWQCFQSNLRRLATGRPVSVLEHTPSKIVGRRLALEAAAALFKPRRCLRLYTSPSAIAVAAGIASERDIPPDIRGDFWFRDLALNVGWHDIFECAENDEGHLFARAFFSVSLHGHGSPSDWPEYRRLVLQVPEVVAVRKAFESVAGPLESCVYWNV
jgi:hypothetical protein